MSVPSISSAAGIYTTLMVSFFGDKSTDEQEQLWLQFLQQEHLTTNPDPSNIQVQQDFMTFVQQARAKVDGSILSPDEVKKRDLMNKTFDLMLELLSVMQKTVYTVGQNVIYLENLEDQYVNMMAKTPLYTQDLNTLTQTKVLDPSSPISTIMSETLGAYGISFNDIAGSFAAASSTDPTLRTPLTFSMQMGLSIPPAAPSGTMIFTIPTSPTDPMTITYIDTDLPTAGNSTTVTIPDGSTFAQRDAIWQSAIQSVVQNVINTYNTLHVPLSVLPAIPVNPTITGTAQVDPSITNPTQSDIQRAQDEQEKAREETNALNQQYIQNATNLKSSIDTRAKDMESLLQTAKDSTGNILTLLKSIIDTFSGILSAIYR